MTKKKLPKNCNVRVYSNDLKILAKLSIGEELRADTLHRILKEWRKKQ